MKAEGTQVRHRPRFGMRPPDRSRDRRGPSKNPQENGNASSPQTHAPSKAHPRSPPAARPSAPGGTGGTLPAATRVRGAAAPLPVRDGFIRRAAGLGLSLPASSGSGQPAGTEGSGERDTHSGPGQHVGPAQSGVELLAGVEPQARRPQRRRTAGGEGARGTGPPSTGPAEARAPGPAGPPPGLAASPVPPHPTPPLTPLPGPCCPLPARSAPGAHGPPVRNRRGASAGG